MDNSTSLPLRDIHLPDSSLWWPLAPGWWIVIIVILGLIGLLIMYVKSSANRKFKNNIRSELTQLLLKYQQQNNPQQFISQLAELMRRVALHYFPRQHLAQLNGKNWLKFLDKCLNDTSTEFSMGIGSIFMYGPYKKYNKENIQEDLDSVHALVKNWINKVMIDGVQKS